MTLALRIDKRLGSFHLDVAIEATSPVTALFGRSGAGKSTIVKAIAGLVTPDAGRIAVGDAVLYDSAASVDVHTHRRSVGLVFQDARLFPHLSVLKNLAYGARFGGARVGRSDVAAMAERLGIDALLARKPDRLSGGEAQRVAIGRALLSGPKLLLMDEPLSGLDQARKADILAVIEDIRDTIGVPIIYVSHAEAEVRRLAGHVVVLANGKVVDQGAPDAVLGHGGFGLARTLQARLTMKNSSDGLSELSVSGGRLFLPQVEAPLGTVLPVEIAARDVMLSVAPPEGLSALNVLPCDIAALRPAADNPSAVDVELACGKDTLLAQVTRRSAETLLLTPGMPVYAIVKSVALAQTSGAMLPVDA